MKIMSIGIVHGQMTDEINYIGFTDGKNNDSISAEFFKWNKLTPRDIRRTDKFTKLLLMSLEASLIDGGYSVEHIEGTETGTVMNTWYGPLNTNLEFAAQVLTNDVEALSPTVFSNTVTNAAMGHMCLLFGLKGESLVLVCTNPLRFAQYVLDKPHIKRVVVSGVDEYSEELSDDINNYHSCSSYNRKRKIIDGAATLILEKNDAKDEQAIILENYDISLDLDFFFNGELVVDRKSKNKILELLRSINVKYPNITSVVVSDVSDKINNIEKSVFEGKEIITLASRIGNMGGANFLTAIGIATKEYLKNDAMLCICNVDISGNYSVVILGGSR